MRNKACRRLADIAGGVRALSCCAARAQGPSRPPLSLAAMMKSACPVRAHTESFAGIGNHSGRQGIGLRLERANLRIEHRVPRRHTLVRVASAPPMGGWECNRGTLTVWIPRIAALLRWSGGWTAGREQRLEDMVGGVTPRVMWTCACFSRRAARSLAEQPPTTRTRWPGSGFTTAWARRALGRARSGC